MFKLLLRFGAMWALLMLLGGTAAQASHLLGGEMTYRYLGATGPAATPFRYRVTVLIYVNSGPTSNVPDGRPSIGVTFYNKSQNGAFIRNVQLPRLSNPSIVPAGCLQPGTTPIQLRLCRYEADVDLPVSFDGYFATYTDGTRNLGITNLQTPSDSQQQTIFMEMAPPLLPNSSPTFSDTAVVVVCQGDTSVVLNNAVDPDGDRLIYTFSTPYDRLATPNQFTPPPIPVRYGTGYSALAPFGTGPGNFASLNASTGLARYAVSQLGNFVVSVEVREFRNINGQEVLIGATRREIQLVSRTCPTNRSPLFTAATVAQRTFTVEEGQTLSFNISATDADGDQLRLRANSVLLDGTGGFNTTFGGQPGVVLTGANTGSVTLSSTAAGTITGPFQFTPRCGDARATPYDVVVTASDVTCGVKTIAEVFQIFVTKTPAPTSMRGDSVVCDVTQVRTYTARGPVPPGGYSWNVRGGTIQGAATGPAVQVRWTNPTQGRITVRNLSAFGCQSDSVSKEINIRPIGNLAVTPATPAICAGQSTTLTASGGTTYTWTNGTQTFTGTSITVSPAQTTTYTVSSSDGVCTASRQVTVTVNQVAVANAGAARAVCSGEATTLGSAALAGYTYQWAPATGLSSATAAQPVFTQTLAAGAAPQTLTYTVTATTAQGCTASSQVTLTLNPAARAEAGIDRVFCSGSSANLGDATSGIAGNTYLWSPATGLSDPTVLNPTVTLTNTGSAPVSTDYTLTVTTAAGCVARDVVSVTVNPAAVANAGANQATCSGDRITLGTSALTGYTYQWAPATGLSSVTAAQPTLLLTNTTNAPQTLTYTVTATTAQGCTASSQVTLTLNPAARAEAGTDRTFCSGGSAQLGAAALTGYTYQWSPAAGLSSATAAQPTATLTNTGTAPIVQEYILTATNAQGCFARDTMRVTVNPAAVANAGAARAVCSGEATTLGSAALAGYTYQWAPATGLSSATAAQPVFTQTLAAGAAPQTLTYTVTATTAQGCTASSQVTLTLNPAAAAQAGPDATICSGKSTRLGAATLTGYTYQWAPATGLSSATAAQPTVTATTGSTATTIRYVLTATTAQGCFARDTVFVLVNPKPELDSIQGSASVCPTVQGVAYSIRNPRGTAYQWLVNGGTIASGQGTAAITVNWGTATNTANVRAFRLNAQGCSSDTVVFPVRVNQILATQRPTGPLSVCQGNGPFTYQVPSPTNGSTYGWEIIGGTQVSTGTGSVVLNWTRPGIGKIVVTESSNPAGGRCLGTSDTLYVTVRPTPTVVQITAPQRVCAGAGSVNFSVPAVANSTYRWTVQAGTGTPTPLAATGATAPFTVPAPGTVTAPVVYTVTAVETNAQGCAGPVATRQFTVVPQLIAAAVTGPRSVCPGSFSGLGYSLAGTAGSTYQWTVVGGTVTSGQGTANVQVDFQPAATTRSVSVSETSAVGCAATFNVVLDNATVALNAATVDLQDDRKITLGLNVPNNTNNGNQVRILRRDAGTGTFTQVATVANTSTSYSDATVNADDKSYDYRLELTNACGTVLNTVNHTTMRLEVTNTQPGQGRTEGTVTLRWNAYVGIPVSRYEVYRAADGNQQQLVAATITSPSAGVFTATLPSSAAGFNQGFRIRAMGADNPSNPMSVWSNQVEVAFENPLAFYNVITPNGDNLNDVFFISNVELYPGNTLSVFNRWGREVYKTTNYRNTWGGDKQPAGTYYFSFTDAAGKVTKGWFEIVR